MASTILYFHPTWKIIDPIISIVFTFIAISFSIPVLKAIIRVLMDATPEKINLLEFENELMKIKYVKEIHDLHISSMSFEKYNLTCHIICTK